MKIAYIYPEILPSRKARSISVINTFNELSNITQCTLFVDQNSKIQDIEKSYNINSSKVKIKKVKKNFLTIKSNKVFNINLLKELTIGGFDIIYARHLKVAKFLIQKGFKVVFESHEIFFQTFQEDNKNNKNKIKSIRFLEEFVYQGCSGMVFVNKTLQNKINNTFKNVCSEQTIAYNGVTIYDQYIKKDFNSVYEIYYVGNFFKWKGVQDAISVMSKIDKISLNLIGGGSKTRIAELKKQILSTDVEDKVVFLGYKNSQNVKNILKHKSKIAIIPNTLSVQNQFSLPIKLYEYMSTSNIVIAADMDTIKEVLIDGVNGFMFESGDIDSLEKTIKKVISTPEERLQKIAKNAYTTSKKFTWEIRAKKIASFCSEINAEN